MLKAKLLFGLCPLRKDTEAGAGQINTISLKIFKSQQF